MNEISRSYHLKNWEDLIVYSILISALSRNVCDLSTWLPMLGQMQVIKGHYKWQSSTCCYHLTWNLTISSRKSLSHQIRSACNLIKEPSSILIESFSQSNKCTHRSVCLLLLKGTWSFPAPQNLFGQPNLLSKISGYTRHIFECPRNTWQPQSGLFLAYLGNYICI